jgi:phosphoglycerate-specific signal transduction histidine kinase
VTKRPYFSRVSTSGSGFGRPATESDPRRPAAALRGEPFDVVLLDMNFSPGTTTAASFLRGARDDHGKVLIQVIDDGPGIDAVHLDDIFLPFFTTKRSGSGVGLSVSRQIMALNKGMLTVKSAPGTGSEFTLRFR